MPSLENLKKQAKQLVRWHRERNYSVAARIRATLPRYRNSTDAELLAAPFSLGLAQEIIAIESGFESWAALKSGVDHMPNTQSVETSKPSIIAACPQLFVSDILAACEFYTTTLGFSVVYVHGEPPFYGEIERDGAHLNLRYVCEPVFNQEMRERESLLSAHCKVSGVKSLYDEFKASGAEFNQTLKRQPWNVRDFVVRDPFGNLLCFSQLIE